GDALDAETKSPPRPEFRIVSDVFKHLRMHHAATGDFEPFLAHFARQRAAEINLETRFGVAEVVWPEPNSGLRSHQLPEHEFDRAFQIADGDVPIHVKPLDLVKSGIVGRISIIAAIHPAWHDD